MRDGIKTTEFWTMIGSVALTIVGLLPGWAAIVAIGAYEISRGLAKGGFIRGTLGVVLRQEK